MWLSNITDWFDSPLTGLSDVGDHISDTWHGILSTFSDIDFTVLYDWMPNDIIAVVTAIIDVLLVLALIGLMRRVLFFLS